MQSTSHSRIAGTLRRTGRALTSSVVSSGFDLMTLLVLVRISHVKAGLAAAIGCVVGGTINFAISRRWVFRNRGSAKNTAQQLALYGLLVVMGSALLAGVLVHVATVRFALSVLVAKGLAAVLVFCCWSYPVAARVVFKKETH